MAQVATDKNEGAALTGYIRPSPEQFSPSFSDTDELQYVARKIIIGTSGDLHYEDQRGNEHTFNFPAGEFNISIRKIYSTGTTLTEDDVLCLI